jgi:hypothetical protein
MENLFLPSAAGLPITNDLYTRYVRQRPRQYFGETQRPRLVHRRRPTFQQGRALEIVGHAIEYLVDMALFDPQCACETEALSILTTASLEIFAECSEVVPISTSLLTWLKRLVSKTRVVSRTAPFMKRSVPDSAFHRKDPHAHSGDVDC